MANKNDTWNRWRLALVILGAPVFMIFGLVALIRGVRRGVHRVRGFQRALGGVLHCAHGHPNPTHGRFRCLTCKATYHGWVGRCEVCGASAGWIACDVCQIAIPLPWVA